MKDRIMQYFKTLAPVEKMEINLMIQIICCEENGIDKTDKLFYDELKETLRRLRNE